MRWRSIAEIIYVSEYRMVKESALMNTDLDDSGHNEMEINGLFLYEIKDQVFY